MPFDTVTQNYKKTQRDTNIATAKSFGVKDPAAIIDYYEQAVERWRPVSKAIGRDIDKFTDVLNQRGLLQGRSREAVDASRRHPEASRRRA